LSGLATREHVLPKIRHEAIRLRTIKTHSSCAGVTLSGKAHPTEETWDVEILEALNIYI
jgi:hypothetical protein